MLDLLEHDNLIVGEGALKVLCEAEPGLPTEGDSLGVVGTFRGLPVRVARTLPRSYVLLRKGEKLVAIIHLVEDKP